MGQVFVTGVPFDSLQQKIKIFCQSITPVWLLIHLAHSWIFQLPSFARYGSLLWVRCYHRAAIRYPVMLQPLTLYSMGGPLEKGSLRDIKVLRKGKEIATVDIYEYLLAGRCTTDVKLQNNDVIFVPRRGKTVAITGSVFRPAIYELKEKENLQNLLLSAAAYPHRRISTGP